MRPDMTECECSHARALHQTDLQCLAPKCPCAAFVVAPKSTQRAYVQFLAAQKELAAHALDLCELEAEYYADCLGMPCPTCAAVPGQACYPRGGFLRWGYGHGERIPYRMIPHGSRLRVWRNDWRPILATNNKNALAALLEYGFALSNWQKHEEHLR